MRKMKIEEIKEYLKHKKQGISGIELPDGRYAEAGKNLETGIWRIRIYEGARIVGSDVGRDCGTFYEGYNLQAEIVIGKEE